MVKKIGAIVIILLLVGLIIFNMLGQGSEYSRTFFYMGTVIDVTIYNVDNDSVLDEVSDLILKYDNMFSRTIKSSEISQLNELGSLTVSDETLYLIQNAIDYGGLSRGYFDITINPIVDLWGIGTESAQVPTDSDIQAALKVVDYQRITIDDHMISLNDTSIDLGGIAKGFIADEIVELLQSKGIEKALVNLGGNVYALGSSSDGMDWNIGIRTPSYDQAGVLLRVMLQDKSVVTSGVYERYLEDDGQIYHHIFDPFTGYPMDNDLLSVTVISDQSMEGDALSTALFNLGKDEAFRLAQQLGVDLIIVTKDNRVFISQSLIDKVELYDNNYTIKEVDLN